MNPLARASRLPFLAGLLALAGYWLSVRPPDIFPGAIEDQCYVDMSRQLMGEQLREFGGPRFVTDRFMAPQGTQVPYMSWSLELHWLGGLAWNWDPGFPFLWAFLALSLLASYVGAGFLLGKMGLPPSAAWALAALVVVFHVPRHFKLWNHYEHQLLHWVVIGLLLDAWIFQRLVRQSRLSLGREAWRGLSMLGVLGSPGYTWGPMLLAWAAVRAAAAWLCWRRQGSAEAVRLEGPWKDIWLPSVLGLAWLALAQAWFVPLFAQARELGAVTQPLSWFAPLWDVARPLWLDPLLKALSSATGWRLALPAIDAPETVVAVGWLYWAPALLGLWSIRKKAGGPGLVLVSPFLFVLFCGIAYLGLSAAPHPFQRLLQAVDPPLRFFRAASRWGLYLPPLVLAVIALCWPELRAEASRLWDAGKRRCRPAAFAAAAAAAVLALLELGWLAHPVKAQPPLPQETKELLRKVRDLPGDTVLNLPFCVAGGNGVCTAAQCPNYPASTLGECLRLWHGKRVYGLYQSRMVAAQCRVYDRAPYTSWFQAWQEDRCLNTAEWTEFCRYLSANPRISAVLVQPDVWTAAGTPGCRARFETALGAPLGRGTYYSLPSRGALPLGEQSLLWYGARCSAAAGSARR